MLSPKRTNVVLVIASTIFLVGIHGLTTTAFSLERYGWKTHQKRVSSSSSSSPFSSSLFPPVLQSTSNNQGESNDIENLKTTLLSKISTLREIEKRDGKASIDFGVKGGELNSTSRAPQKVDYYAISPQLGQAADDIGQVCQQLSDYAYNNATTTTITSIPTQYLGNRENGTLAPLHGAWKLLFTTAADATFSSNSTRGAAKAQNIVDGCKGTIRNVIDFATKPDGTEPILKQLNVVIKATAVSSRRVELQFQYVKALLTKFFFFPKFGRKYFVLYIPVPGPFITRCIVFFSRIFKGKGAKTVPKAYFDILYLDSQLRIHKTGEDNLFVQARESWESAQPLLESS